MYVSISYRGTQCRIFSSSTSQGKPCWSVLVLSTLVPVSQVFKFSLLRCIGTLRPRRSRSRWSPILTGPSRTVTSHVSDQERRQRHDNTSSMVRVGFLLTLFYFGKDILSFAVHTQSLRECDGEITWSLLFRLLHPSPSYLLAGCYLTSVPTR